MVGSTSWNSVGKTAITATNITSTPAQENTFYSKRTHSFITAITATNITSTPVLVCACMCMYASRFRTLLHTYKHFVHTYKHLVDTYKHFVDTSKASKAG